MDKLFVLDLVLFSSIALNLAFAGLACWRAHLYTGKLKVLTSSPAYWCARLGHNLEYDMITLENHQPPQFEWTHIHKFTCQNCDFVEQVNQRQAIFAPGVTEIQSRWLGPMEQD